MIGSVHVKAAICLAFKGQNVLFFKLNNFHTLFKVILLLQFVFNTPLFHLNIVYYKYFSAGIMNVTIIQIISLLQLLSAVVLLPVLFVLLLC